MHATSPCSGWLLIAEVKSRLDPNNNGADPTKFCKAVEKLGFSSVSKVPNDCIFIYQLEKRFLYFLSVSVYLMMQDFSNKMFVLFYFKKKVV